MSLRILSVAPPLVSLFFFSAFVVAGVNVMATCSDSSFSWTHNSLGQSPCIVAAYMLSTCYQGSYTLDPLSPENGPFAYEGPNNVDNATECDCSTIGYSLITACGACQGAYAFPWSMFVSGCGSLVEPPSQFPNPVPTGINVPHWAILDVTNEDIWNADESHAAGDTPEYGPGAIFGASGVTTGTSTVTSTGFSTPTVGSVPSTSSGAIAGGVVGGIAAISIIAAAVFIYLRRRSRTPDAEFVGAGASQPHIDDAPRPLSDGGTVASSPLSGSPVTMKFHDPNDTTTILGHPGQQSLDMPTQVSLPIGSGSSMAITQTSSQGSKGYHGLPMPSV